MMYNINIINPYGFIYITTNLINGKKYIGQKIFDRHWKNYLGSGKKLKYAIKKYGKENFIREIIAIAYSKEELNNLEIVIINSHNAVVDDSYYNIAYGGGTNTGLHFSEEHKNKISNSEKGKIASEETRLRISNSKKGIILSEEHKLKISRTISEKYKYEERYTPEQKRKRSEANKGAKNPSARAVVQFNLNGNYINTYATAVEAYNITKTPPDGISKCCKGKQLTSGGFRWMYKEDYDKELINNHCKIMTS